MYLRCVELGADDLQLETQAVAEALARRATTLGANAVTSPTGSIPPLLRDAAKAAGLKIIGAEPQVSERSLASAWTNRSITTWPNSAPGLAAAGLARRHRLWPNSLTWVHSATAHGAAAPSGRTPPNDAPSTIRVPSNVIAVVRRMAGRPGRGFSAPWPDHPRDPAWAPLTVLPEPPPTTLPIGRGFAVNLWLCHDPEADRAHDAASAVQVTATVRWGDQVHSWAFTGPAPDIPVATIGTLPLVRPLSHPLFLELSLTTNAESDSLAQAPWRYELIDDNAGVPFWSLIIPDE